jgi:RND family efflux transporter MFP subunit
VLRVAQDGPRDVVFSVPEDKVPMLRALAGTRGALRVRLWGDEPRALAATVREVAAAADPITRTFLIKGDVGQGPFRLGQTATVTMALRSPAGAIKLPLAAVFEQQGRSTVWVLDRVTMTVRAQPIQVAGAEGNLLLVASGITAGQVIVSAGVHALTPGQKVTLYGDATVPASSAAAGR